MIGRLDPLKKTVIVVGGGVSGLLMAYQCMKKGFEVHLYESASEFGGLISTHILSADAKSLGFAESAAHSLLMSEPVEKLFKELGLEVLTVNKDSKSRYIFRDGRMRKFPLSTFETFRMLFRVLFVPAFSRLKVQTLEAWALRHIGRPALDHLLTPFTVGVYGVRPNELSQTAAFPALSVGKGRSLFFEFLFRKLFGAKKARRPQMVTLKEGMGSLTKALVRALESSSRVHLHANAAIASIDALKEKHDLSGCNVAICTPANEAAEILSKDFSILKSIAYAPLVSVTVLAQTEQFKKKPCGVGVLASPDSKLKCLGVLFNSCAFSNRVLDSAWTSLTMMYPENVLNEELPKITRADLDAIFGIHPGELHLKIFRWKKAIPKYDATLELALEKLRSSLEQKPGLIVFGNYTGQVSLRGMIETVTSI